VDAKAQRDRLNERPRGKKVRKEESFKSILVKGKQRGFLKMTTKAGAKASRRGGGGRKGEPPRTRTKGLASSP